MQIVSMMLAVIFLLRRKCQKFVCRVDVKDLLFEYWIIISKFYVSIKVDFVYLKWKVGCITCFKWLGYLFVVLFTLPFHIHIFRSREDSIPLYWVMLLVYQHVNSYRSVRMYFVCFCFLWKCTTDFNFLEPRG